MTNRVIPFVVVLCLASSAQAEPPTVVDEKPTVMLIPAGTWLAHKEMSIETTEPLYAMNRHQVEKMIANILLAKKLRQDVVACTAALDTREEPPSRWRWAAIGAAVVGAFALGMAAR